MALWKLHGYLSTIPSQPSPVCSVIEVLLCDQIMLWIQQYMGKSARHHSMGKWHVRIQREFSTSALDGVSGSWSCSCMHFENTIFLLTSILWWDGIWVIVLCSLLPHNSFFFLFQPHNSCWQPLCCQPVPQCFSFSSSYEDLTF
jgi:hypothetical protein